MELNDSQLTYKCQPQKKGTGGLTTSETSPVRERHNHPNKLN